MKSKQFLWKLEGSNIGKEASIQEQCFIREGERKPVEYQRKMETGVGGTV